MLNRFPDLHPGGWRSLPLDAALRVVATGPMPELPDATEREVAACWTQARAERPDLFDGIVFCADRVTADRVDGHWTRYSRVTAQMRRPSLAHALRINALAVNGLLCCADGLVLGRRQPDAVYMPGRWQAAPAGSVEARDGDEVVDLASQLLAELDEELGLGGNAVSRIAPVVAVAHPDSRIVDIGCLVATSLQFAEIERRWRSTGNREYDALRLVSPDAVSPLLDRDDDALLPTARILLRCWLQAPSVA